MEAAVHTRALRVLLSCVALQTTLCACGKSCHDACRYHGACHLDATGSEIVSVSVSDDGPGARKASATVIYGGLSSGSCSCSSCCLCAASGCGCGRGRGLCPFGCSASGCGLCPCPSGCLVIYCGCGPSSVFQSVSCRWKTVPVEFYSFSLSLSLFPQHHTPFFTDSLLRRSSITVLSSLFPSPWVVQVMSVFLV